MACWHLRFHSDPGCRILAFSFDAGSLNACSSVLNPDRKPQASSVNHKTAQPPNCTGFWGYGIQHQLTNSEPSCRTRRRRSSWSSSRWNALDFDCPKPQSPIPTFMLTQGFGQKAKQSGILVFVDGPPRMVLQTAATVASAVACEATQVNWSARSFGPQPQTLQPKP